MRPSGFPILELKCRVFAQTLKPVSVLRLYGTTKIRALIQGEKLAAEADWDKFLRDLNEGICRRPGWP